MGGLVGSGVRGATGRQAHHGKAILFARADLRFPADGPWAKELTAPAEWPDFADLPRPGDAIPAGRPILTFFATGPSAEACVTELRRTALELELWLYRGASVG
jgi:hypothetical protein